MATQPLARYGATYGRARERLDHRQLHHLGGHDPVPPEYVGAGTIVTAALDRLNAHGPDALGALPADRILKVLTALCITEPRRANRWRRLERIGRGIGRWLHLNRRGLSMASHPHNLGT